MKKIETFFILILEKFYLASSSDVLWSRIDRSRVLEVVYEGIGCDGTEREEWERHRQEAGLPWFNMMKLQWLAHNLSRLKIFYGTLKRQSTSRWSLFHCLSDVSGTSEHSFRGEKIIIVGHSQRLLSDSSSSPSTVFLQQLMYIIPSSATQAHRDTTRSQPILSGFHLREIEPSPPRCRSRRQSDGTDSGIRVESHSQYPAMTYRRVGDDRLSVLQFDYQEGQFSYKREQYRELLQELFYKCAATILVLSCSDHSDPTELSTVFRSLYSMATHHLWVKTRQDSNVLQDMSIEGSHKAVQRSSSTNSPLLVIVAISSSSESDPLNKGEVQRIVTVVSDAVRSVLHSERGLGQVKRNSQQTRLWYVQPISGESELGTLDMGVFGGVNWLVRAMMKSKL